MNCPHCNADTVVTRTRLSDSKSHVLRERRCKGARQHRFETSEQDVLRVDQIAVRQSGDQRIKGAFDVNRLKRDLRNAIYYSTNDAEERAAVDNVAQAVERQILERRYLMQQLKPGEKEALAHDRYRYVILDNKITKLVEEQLEGPELRVQKVLYALYARGRGDRNGREGWTARDALEWIYEQYPDLRRADPRTPPASREFIWHPPTTTPMPLIVLKRTRRPTEFVLEQFVRSIEKALLGRPKSRETAAMVASWVLDGLGGQLRVHSTQLSVGVLECLRRVDQLAFLRAAIIVKGLDSVGAIADEARGLLQSPPPRLHLTVPTARVIATGEPLIS